MNHKIIFFATDSYKVKYKLIINKRESTGGLKYLNDTKVFVEYSNDVDDIYKNNEEYNPNKKQKILIVFCDMIADMLSNKNLNSIVIELFLRERKLNISLIFIKESFFDVPENLRLNSIYYFLNENSKQKRTSTNYI